MYFERGKGNLLLMHLANRLTKSVRTFKYNRVLKSNKSQVPNNKLQAISKLQYPMTETNHNKRNSEFKVYWALSCFQLLLRSNVLPMELFVCCCFGHWILEFVIYLLFGVCDLEFIKRHSGNGSTCKSIQTS